MIGILQEVPANETLWKIVGDVKGILSIKYSIFVYLKNLFHKYIGAYGKNKNKEFRTNKAGLLG